MKGTNGNSGYPLLSKREIRYSFDQLAPSYSRQTWPLNHLLGVNRLRRKLIQKVEGRILDVACGTGENFPFYSSDSDITAIDLSPAMVQAARQRAEQLGLNVELRVMDAESLEFPDNSFDVVTSALSTCTFPHPVTALQEMGRVCRQSGRILLIEHGRSSWELLGRYQDRRARKHFEANAGCRWNQEPEEIVQTAGLDIVSSRRALLGIFHAIEATPPQ